MPIAWEPGRGLTAELDALCTADPAALTDRDTVVELHRQLARLEALTARAVAAFDARRTWQEDGARTAAAWVGVRCRVASMEARRRLRAGRACGTCRSWRRRGGPGS